MQRDMHKMSGMMRKNIYGRRDAESGKSFRRFRSIEGKPADDGTLRLVISTDEPCDMRGWTETLSHAPEAVDASTCRALLINHDPNRIAGTVDSVAFDGHAGTAQAKVLPSAKMESGIAVSDAVACGALRGVSIAYTYESRDCQIDDKARTVVVNKWRLLEASLTPIPADAGAGVRSFPSNQLPTEKESTMPESVDPKPADKPVDPPIADQIAAARVEARAIARLATSVGLPADDFVGLALPDAQARMLAAVAQRDAGKAPVTPSPIKVTIDEGDKLRVATRNTLLSRAQIALTPDEKAESQRLNVGQVNVSLRHLIRQVALASGEPAQTWSDLDLAAFGARLVDIRTHGRRDAANNSTAMFSTVLANVATKAIMAGLTGYNASTWEQWCTQRNVPDFRAVSNVGLAAGRLTKTAENAAFPELLQRDGGYNSTLGMYGATVSLSTQMLVNDQLGVFMDQLRRVGAIASLTIDRQVYYALMNATWTNDTAAAPLSTLSNIDVPRNGLRGKLSPAGEKMGIMGRYVLHSPKYAVLVQTATGKIYTGGQTVGVSLGSQSLVPIESHWIDDTALLSGALYTDYYMTGDPNVVDTVLVNFLEGVGRSPMIQPFDAGAVAAEKWKIMVPFEATVATHTDITPAARITGIQKATAA